MRLRILLLCVLAALATAVAAVPALAGTRSDFQADVVRLVNAERAAHGLRAVRLDARLSAAAAAHARDMLRREYFSHSSPEGSTCASRARRAGYCGTGYASWRISEVIAWGAGWKGTPEAVVDAWMHSPFHRAVILGKAWRDAGVACVEGEFQGWDGSRVYTVDFGRRVR